MGFEQCFEGTCIVGDPDCMWESIPKFRSNTLKSAISQSTFSFTEWVTENGSVIKTTKTIFRHRPFS